MERDAERSLSYYLLTGLIAVGCAIFVILERMDILPSTLSLEGMVIATTDFFVMLAAGLCGARFGLLTFTVIFAGELFSLRANPTLPLFSLFIYLLTALAAGYFSERRWYRSLLRTAVAAAAFILMLAGSWYLLTSTLLVDGFATYTGMSLFQLYLSAAPEVLLSQFLLYALFRWLPDNWKDQVGQGFRYTKSYEERLGSAPAEKPSALGVRITGLVLLEGLLLGALAVFFSNVRMNVWAPEVSPQDRLLDSIQLGILIVTTTVPVAFVLNELIRKILIQPVNRMSRIMEGYFEGASESRTQGMAELKKLNIQSKDEIGQLYRAMGHMVDDLSHHIETLQKEKELEDEVLRQTRRTAHLTREFMEALASTVDAKDHYTSGHSSRVAKYSKEIARRMGKSPQEQEDIYVMGLLHDIGKIGVPESIINKTGRLTDEEFAQIKQHPVIGYNILKNVTELPGLATGARWHHERYGGGGYPDGLAGTDIPEEARIIGVADAYDAMTSQRAYSQVRPQAEVRAEILRCKGTQFDPAVADIMVRMIDEDIDYRMREMDPIVR